MVVVMVIECAKFGLNSLSNRVHEGLKVCRGGEIVLGTGRLSMIAAIVLLAPIDELKVLSDFSGAFHDLLGVGSCCGAVVVKRVWGSGRGGSKWALPGGVCIASGLVCGKWCAYQQVSPLAHLGK